VAETNKGVFQMQSVVIPDDRVPGSTMYMFSGHFPVEVPLVWIWKCVLVASEVDGGAPRTWFETITDEEETYALKCPNLERSSRQDEDLRRHLQLQLDIYESNKLSELETDVYVEMLEVMQSAVDYWSVVPVPSVQCRKVNNLIDPAECNTQQYDALDKQCWLRLIRPQLQMLDEQQKTQLSCATEDAKCTLFDVILKVLFGRNRKTLENMNGITIKWLLENDLARELNLDYQFNSNYDYTDTIPEFELTNLQFLNESVIYNTNSDAYSTSAQGVSCPDQTEALSHAEYEISKAILR
jgi:hypothetical protein